MPPGAVPLTVFMPHGRDYGVATLEYKVSCESDPAADPAFRQARLEATNVSYPDPDRPADVWGGYVEADSGECVVTFHAVHANEELVCVASQTLDVSAGTEVLFAVLVCYADCSRIDLPRAGSSSKTICLPDSGLLLSAATPIERENIVAVRYALRLAELPDPGTDAFEGTLERRWLGTADFGDGLVQTYTWQATIGILDWVHWGLELTAVNEAGNPVCRTETRINLEWNIVNTVHVVMPCAP